MRSRPRPSTALVPTALVIFTVRVMGASRVFEFAVILFDDGLVGSVFIEKIPAPTVDRRIATFHPPWEDAELVRRELVVHLVGLGKIQVFVNSEFELTLDVVATTALLTAERRRVEATQRRSRWGRRRCSRTGSTG